MKFHNGLFWLVFLYCANGQQVPGLPEYVASECYGDIFSFDCGPGNKIRINRDFFGFSPRSVACSYSPGDCVVSNPKSNSLVHRYCTGRRKCTYYQVERRACDGVYSNYQQVEYQCIPDSLVMDVCSELHYQTNAAFLGSPNFPDNYPPNRSCRCIVTSQSPGTRVRLEFVYMAVKFDSPCRDWLKVGRRRMCGTSVDLFSGTRIPIEFHSDHSDAHSGFWLHFHSSSSRGRLDIQCGNSTPTTTTTTTTVAPTFPYTIPTPAPRTRPAVLPPGFRDSGSDDQRIDDLLRRIQSRMGTDGLQENLHDHRKLNGVTENPIINVASILESANIEGNSRDRNDGFREADEQALQPPLGDFLVDRVAGVDDGDIFGSNNFFLDRVRYTNGNVNVGDLIPEFKPEDGQEEVHPAFKSEYSSTTGTRPPEKRLLDEDDYPSTDYTGIEASNLKNERNSRTNSDGGLTDLSHREYTRHSGDLGEGIETLSTDRLGTKEDQQPGNKKGELGQGNIDRIGATSVPSIALGDHGNPVHAQGERQSRNFTDIVVSASTPSVLSVSHIQHIPTPAGGSAESSNGRKLVDKVARSGFDQRSYGNIKVNTYPQSVRNSSTNSINVPDAGYTSEDITVDPVSTSIVSSTVKELPGNDPVTTNSPIRFNENANNPSADTSDRHAEIAGTYDEIFNVEQPKEIDGEKYRNYGFNRDSDDGQHGPNHEVVHGREYLQKDGIEQDILTGDEGATFIQDVGTSYVEEAFTSKDQIENTDVGGDGLQQNFGNIHKKHTTVEHTHEPTIGYIDGEVNENRHDSNYDEHHWDKGDGRTWLGHEENTDWYSENGQIWDSKDEAESNWYTETEQIWENNDGYGQGVEDEQHSENSYGEDIWFNNPQTDEVDNNGESVEVTGSPELKTTPTIGTDIKQPDNENYGTIVGDANKSNKGGSSTDLTDDLTDMTDLSSKTTTPCPVQTPVASFPIKGVSSDTVDKASDAGDSELLSTDIKHDLSDSSMVIHNEDDEHLDVRTRCKTDDAVLDLKRNISDITAGNDQDIAPVLGEGNLVTLGLVILAACVGIGLVFLFIFLLVLYCRRKRQRNEQTQTPTSRDANGSSVGSGQSPSGRELLHSSLGIVGGMGYRKGAGHQTKLTWDSPFQRNSKLHKYCQVDLDFPYHHQLLDVLPVQRPRRPDRPPVMYATPSTHGSRNNKSTQAGGRNLDYYAKPKRGRVIKERSPDSTMISNHHSSGSRTTSQSLPRTSSSTQSDPSGVYTNLSFNGDLENGRRLPTDLFYVDTGTGPGSPSRQNLEAMRQRSMDSMPELSELIVVPESSATPSVTVGPGSSAGVPDFMSDDSDWETRSAISI